MLDHLNNKLSKFFYNATTTPFHMYCTCLMADIYNTDRFEVLYTASQAPPIENLGLAARYVAVLFRQNNVPAAFLGGWAVYLRGSGRTTNDVDMTVRSTMAQLIQILELQPR